MYKASIFTNLKQFYNRKLFKLLFQKISLSDQEIMKE